MIQKITTAERTAQFTKIIEISQEFFKDTSFPDRQAIIHQRLESFGFPVNLCEHLEEILGDRQEQALTILRRANFDQDQNTWNSTVKDLAWITAICAIAVDVHFVPHEQIVDEAMHIKDKMAMSREAYKQFTEVLAEHKAFLSLCPDITNLLLYYTNKANVVFMDETVNELPLDLSAEIGFLLTHLVNEIPYFQLL